GTCMRVKAGAVGDAELVQRLVEPEHAVGTGLDLVGQRGELALKGVDPGGEVGDGAGSGGAAGEAGLDPFLDLGADRLAVREDPALDGLHLLLELADPPLDIVALGVGGHRHTRHQDEAKKMKTHDYYPHGKLDAILA